MLVLSRKQDESVTIIAGEHTIKVSIADARGSQILLGFEAPATVKIHRTERGKFNTELNPATRKDLVEVAKNALSLLGDEERLDAMEGFCSHCGDTQSLSSRCKCWNDE